MLLSKDSDFDTRDYLRSEELRQFIKFGIVGVSNFIVSFSVYYLIFNYAKLSVLTGGGEPGWGLSVVNLLDQFGITSLDGAVANTLGYLAGILNSYLLNKKWTFKIVHKDPRQFRRFIVFNVLCAVLSTAGIFVFVDLLSWPYRVTWIGVNGSITLLNFIGYKLWVFRA